MDSDNATLAGRREWIGLSVLALACLVYAMDLTVLHLAVPHLSEDLQPSSAELLWIVDIYGFLVAGSLITMGTLGDRIGRRRLLLIGAVAFSAGSVLAAFAPTAELLIAARALLGLAGATVAPSTLSLIRNMFHDPKQRSVAIAVWITAYSVGGTVGPIVGGTLLEFFWWGSVFLLALPVMGLLLLIGPKFLPEFKDPDAGRLDLLSAGLSLAGVLGVIYGLKRIAEDGVDLVALLAILAGLALAAAFIVRQARLTDPLIDLDLFRIPAFSAALITNLLSAFAAFGSFLFTYQYLQLVLGKSPLEAGVWSIPSSIGFIAGSMGVQTLARGIRPAYLVTAGLVTGAAALAVLAQVGEDSLAVIVVGTTVLMLGLAPVFTLTTDLIVGSAPPERAGAASAMSETAGEFGAALGIAVLGSIGTAIYRREVADAVPAGVSGEDAAAAEDTLGGAVAAADQLADPLGTALLDVAREAFVQGLQLTFIVAGAVMVATAIVAAILLRRIEPPAGGSQAEAGTPEPALEAVQVA